MSNLDFNETIIFSVRGTKIETTLGTLSTFPTSKLYHLAQKLIFDKRTSERLEEAIYGQHERQGRSAGDSLSLQDSESNELYLDDSPLAGRGDDTNSQDKDMGMVDVPSQHAQIVDVYVPDPAYKFSRFQRTNSTKFETLRTYGYDTPRRKFMPMTSETKRRSSPVDNDIPISRQNPRSVRKTPYELTQLDSDDGELVQPSTSQLSFQPGFPFKRRRLDTEERRAEEGFFIDRDPTAFLKLLAYHDVIAINGFVVYEVCVARETKYWKIEYPEAPKTPSFHLCLITVDMSG
jgi:hypothetical protein